jgi:tetratricopeptide (TPR) repeat protein
MRVSGIFLTLNLCTVLALGQATWLQESLSLLKSGDLDKASAIARKAAQQFPHDAMPLVVLGTIDIQRGELDLAERDLLGALKYDPRLVGARLNLATIYTARQQWKQAHAQYEAVLQNDSANPKALLGLIEIGEVEDNPPEIAKWSDKLLAEDPENVSVLLKGAHAANLLGDSEKALAYLLRAQKVAPGDFQVLYPLGAMCLQMDLTKDALRFLDEAVKLRPDDFHANYALGSARLTSGDFDGAQKIFDDLLEKNPSNYQLEYAIGSVLYLRGQMDLAEQHLNRSEELNSKQVEPLYYLGLIANQRGDSQMAVKYLQEVVAHAPNHARAHLELGKLYLQRQDMDHAREELQSAVRLDPDLTAAHYQLGILLNRVGQKDEAREQLDLAARLRDDSHRVDWELTSPGTDTTP